MENQSKIEQAKISTENIIKEVEKAGHEQAIKTAKSMMSELKRIEEKQRCVRVRILDWLADTISHYGNKWSTGLRTMADNIHSPCAIKLPQPQKTSK